MYDVFLCLLLKECSYSSVDLKLCVSICHCVGMLWVLAVIYRELHFKENSRLLKQLCALDTALDSQ